MDKELLIEAYFENTLTSEDQAIFEDLLKSDKAFADQVDFEKNTKIAITLEARKKLKQQLQSYESEFAPKTSRKLLWIVAASIAILLGVLTLFNTNRPSNTDLFAEYFEPYPNIEAPLVRGSNQATDKTQAFTAYESGDFKTAAILFNQIYESENEEYSRFYGAMSLMALGEYEASKEILITTGWSENYSERVNWFLALDYLRLNQTKNARTLLENIVQKKQYQNKNAEELLKKLK